MIIFFLFLNILKKKTFKIKQKFRIICTCSSKKLKNISPAFLSRFDVIYLEDQLENIQDHKKLIKNLFKRFKKLEENERNNKNKQDINALKKKGIEFIQGNNNDNLDYKINDNLRTKINEKINLLNFLNY